MKQGCPLSPILFNLMIAHLEERIVKRGEVYFRKSRVCSLANADCVVLMADDVCGMRLMLRDFEEYVRGKYLCMNVKKTKVLRFRKRKG